MSTAVPKVCEWFLGCRRPAVALVAHPIKPMPTCAGCIERMGLRHRIVATILTPEGGEPVLVQHERHIDLHLFHGACICPCALCTDHPSEGVTRCTCSACPPALCGAKAGVAS